MAAKTVVSAPALFSTPHSKHLSSAKNVEGIIYKSTLDENKPFVKVDLQSTHEVELDHFLAAFAKMDMESLRDADRKVDPDIFKGEFEKIHPDMKTIATNPTVLQLRNTYCSAKGPSWNKELHRYGPFARLANKILELLCGTKDIPIAFCRNDPHQLGGVLNNFRTPDVVVIDGSHKSVKGGKWQDYSRLDCKVSRDTRYTWADVLFTIEFKLREDPIPVEEQSADAEPESVPRTSRRSVSSNPVDGEFILGASASSTPHFSSLPDGVAAVPGSWPSDSGPLSASRYIFTEPLTEAGPSHLGKKSSQKKSGARQPVTMSKSRGRGGSNRAGRDIESEPTHNVFYPPSESFTGDKRSLSVESEAETEGSRIKRRRNNGNSNRAPVEVCEQGLCYAIEQFSYLHNLRHVYNAIVIDGKMWICYYDHAGIIRTSQPLDFVNDLFRFVLLLKCMMDMSKVERGVSEQMVKIDDMNMASSSISNDTSDVVKADTAAPIAKADTDLNATQKDATPGSFDLIAQFGLSVKGQVFRFIRRLINARFYGLLGRATEVVEAKLVRLEGNVAKCPIGIGKIVAVKMSWPPKSRVSEVEIIKKGRKILQTLDEKDEDYKKNNGIEGKLEDCLPVVYESEDQDDLVEAEGCFRQRLNVLKFVDGVENRVWRTIVFELLIPIYMLDDLRKFKKCFRGIFQGHHFLWDHGIMHRDISIGNLMCRLGEDDEVCGVLNDWDLAKLKDSKESTSNSRTGTRPFMARDLLTDEPVEHLERFDWESMLYVLVWIACRYGSGGVLKKPSALLKWLEHDLETLQDNKTAVCGCIYPPLTEHYEELTSWIDPMLNLFASGYKAKAIYERALEKAKEKSMTMSDTFDSKTLGGHVTYKKLREIYIS
ncbi:hypothetical protein M0805_004064 [Coniferiporia weirii]|nr:hypothetical protein M0805_004064 [Coniferiporia weirii]